MLLSVAQSNISHVMESLDAVENALEGELPGTVRDAVDMAHDEAVREIPKRTGRTASTIRTSSHRIPRGAVGSVYSTDEIAYYLEVGTREHVIRPRHRKALRFEVDGRVVFARMVHHPGTRAYRWLEKTQYATSSPISELFERKVEDVLRAL